MKPSTSPPLTLLLYILSMHSTDTQSWANKVHSYALPFLTWATWYQKCSQIQLLRDVINRTKLHYTVARLMPTFIFYISSQQDLALRMDCAFNRGISLQPIAVDNHALLQSLRHFTLISYLDSAHHASSIQNRSWATTSNVISTTN